MASFYEKIGLLRGLLSGSKAFAGPFAVTVDVTRRCNLQCLGCAAHSPYVKIRSDYDPAVEDLDVEMFERLCGELRTMNTGTVVFCGDGEPLLHPRFFDLACMAKSSGFRTVLLTNGTLIDESRAHSLVDSRIDLVRVSLWGSSHDEFERNCTGIKADYFARVVHGLRLMASVKESSKDGLPRVALHAVINRNNLQSIDSFVGLALETGCNAVSFSPLHTIHGQLDCFSLSREEEGMLRMRLLKAKDKLRSYKLEHNIDETIRRYRIGAEVRRKIPCYIPWMQCRMKMDGTVLPCNPCRWPVGNFQKQSFREIWNSRAYHLFRKKILSSSDAVTIDEVCDCSFCCFVDDNLRVHRFYKYLAPLSLLFGKAETMSEL